MFSQKHFDSLSRSCLSSDMAKELWEISETFAFSGCHFKHPATIFFSFLMLLSRKMVEPFQPKVAYQTPKIYFYYHPDHTTPQHNQVFEYGDQ